MTLVKKGNQFCLELSTFSQGSLYFPTVHQVAGGVPFNRHFWRGNKINIYIYIYIHFRCDPDRKKRSSRMLRLRSWTFAWGCHPYQGLYSSSAYGRSTHAPSNITRQKLAEHWQARSTSKMALNSQYGPKHVLGQTTPQKKKKKSKHSGYLMPGAPASERCFGRLTHFAVAEKTTPSMAQAGRGANKHIW